MALKPCKECKTEVSTSAKTCPHCGVKNPTVTKLQGCLGIFFVMVILGAIISIFDDPSDKESNQTTNNVQRQHVEYLVIQEEDNSIANRNRQRWYILAPDAVTFQQLSSTAVKAAMDLAKKNNTDVADVLIEVASSTAGKGYPVAKATYIPDGMGISGRDKSSVWEASAITQLPTEQQKDTLIAWYENRDRFQVDGVTDEDNLKSYLSDKLSIPVEQVSLPWFELSSVTFSKEDQKPKKTASVKAQCASDDSQCLYSKYTLDAVRTCRPLIQRLAKYDYDWTDGMLTPTFSHFRHNQSTNTMTFIGDQIKMVNGFGNEIRHTYECDFDMGTKKVVNYSAQPGRIQS